MKPAPFEYHAPRDVEEAIALVAAHGADARPLAGGQSLVPMMNFRLARPAVLVDLNGVAGLAGVAADGDGWRIGAMTRQRDIETDARLRDAVPLLPEATRHIAHLPIRARGTIGGSLAHADPAAEYPAVAVALDCTIAVRGPGGARAVPASEFFSGALSTALADDEILDHVFVPPLPAATGTAFAEIARRRGDFALAGVAAKVTLDGDGVRDVRLSACGVAPAPVRLEAAEAALRAGGAGPAAVDEAAAAASRECAPGSDIHATGAHRRRLLGAMVREALGTALARAGGAR